MHFSGFLHKAYSKVDFGHTKILDTIFFMSIPTIKYVVLYLMICNYYLCKYVCILQLWRIVTTYIIICHTVNVAKFYWPHMACSCTIHSYYSLTSLNCSQMLPFDGSHYAIHICNYEHIAYLQVFLILLYYLIRLL